MNMGRGPRSPWRAKPTIKPEFVLPPSAFSNAMNKIYPDWNPGDWPNSKEWKLFNAGRAAAVSDAAMEAAGMFKEFRELSEQGGVPRRTT